MTDAIQTVREAIQASGTRDRANAALDRVEAVVKAAREMVEEPGFIAHGTFAGHARDRLRDSLAALDSTEAPRKLNPYALEGGTTP